jgi:2-oxo-4-hydroxy-4-carboxy--5-ureidoimidazoline (OHCU) decarboxylase
MWLELRHNGKSIRKSAKTRSWEQGQKLARAEEERYELAVLGEKPKPVAVTVEEAANSFMDTKKGEGLDKDTLQKHRRMTALLLDYCHRKNLRFIRHRRSESGNYVLGGVEHELRIRSRRTIGVGQPIRQLPR